MRSRLALSLLACAIFGVFASSMLALAADTVSSKQLPGILIDDEAAEKKGPWVKSTHTKPYLDQGYIHSGISSSEEAKQPKSLTFRTKISKPGRYTVYFAYSKGDGRSKQVPVEIHHAAGIEKLRVDQTAGNGPQPFYTLGEFEFESDQDAVVVVSDKDAKGIVTVDGVLFLPLTESTKLIAAIQKQLGASAKVAKKKELAPKFVRQPQGSVATLDSTTLDQMIVEQAYVTKTTEIVDDEIFLRRATLDIVGRIPTEQERLEFLAATHPAKRSIWIDKLLDSPEFGENWAHYWSDVFSYRIPQPELTFLNYEVTQDWLAKHLNQGTGWDEISYRIITATGMVKENPAAFFVGFQQADKSRLAGETTRVFLGTQIHCAECHDHPFVDIPQERFHQMAAFFVRSSAKLPWNDSSEILVTSSDKGEHKMPESNQVMLPAVFSGDPLPEGASDIERRVKLAKWVTNPENPLFAKAFVNRIWERLMDQPFCDPIDEISDLAGSPSLPDLHGDVADHFRANNYDAKSLFRLLMNTKAYQRELDAEDEIVGQLTSAEFRKMRGNVVFNSLETAINLPNVKGEPIKESSAVRFPPPPKSTKDIVDEVFGYDPSLGKDFRPQTMQQAMFLMNNKQVQAEVKAGKDQETKLAKILTATPDNRQAIIRLYVNVLGRQPDESELKVAYQFVEEVESRESAFEDLLWALLNTAEFTTRH